MTYLLTCRMGGRTYYHRPGASLGRVWQAGPGGARQYPTLEAAKDARAGLRNGRGVLIAVYTAPDPAPRPKPVAPPVAPPRPIRRPDPVPQVETGPWYVIGARQGERFVLATHATREKAVRMRDRLSGMEDCTLTVEGATACSL